MTVATIVKWIARLLVLGAGIGFLATGASMHPVHVPSIVTGIALIILAVYATIRDLAGTVRAEDEQIVGLISPSTWYDWVVFLVLIAAVVIAWIVG